MTMTRAERFAAMGTRVELHLYGRCDDDVVQAARQAIEAVDDALTIHRPSPTTILNDALMAGRSAAVDDPLLIEAIEAIDAAYPRLLGLFDPAADHRLAGSGWSALSYDRASGRLSATRPSALDFGGFGKGFALDRTAAILRAGGVASALLSAGESSVTVIGEHPLGGGWPFALPDPFGDGVLIEVEIIDQALSISSTVGAGTAAPERSAMIRPGDAAPVTTPHCTLAIDRSGALAEMVSTALLVADERQAADLIAARPQQLFRFAPRRASDDRVAA
ncbi:FAD:protein FMN transferase [Sphingomonas asaccharolytica]|uniref:FAD:protein FMN transferase n=1 Tax=Sphingomonas asaccharolytica TaxID=40681 RepID=UPI0008298C35|nr:FAD:protein FMN transferase [Sphingomonas asaccharolytica]